MPSAMLFRCAVVVTWVVAWLLSGGQARAEKPIMLFDMIPAMNPGSSKLALPIFTRVTFPPGSSCRLVAGPPAAVIPVPSATASRRLFTQAPWMLASWITNPALPNLCGGVASAMDGTITLSTPDPAGGPPAFGLVLAPGSVTMSLNSRGFWQVALHAPAPLFRATSALAIGWPNFIIDASMSAAQHNLVWMDQMRRLDLVFDGTLNAVHIDHVAAWPAGKPLPAGAQLTDDPLKHATQLRLSFGIQYLLKPGELAAAACHDPAARQPVCAYNGKFFHYMITIYDNRFAYLSRWRTAAHPDGAPRFMEDIGTNAMMYGTSLEQLMSPAQRQAWYAAGRNPYAVPGQRFRIEANLYPLIRAAILATQTQDMADYARGANGRSKTPALPPRLPGESAAQYVAHFAVTSGNIGYEVSGLADISFTVHQFSLTAVP